MAYRHGCFVTPDPRVERYPLDDDLPDHFHFSAECWEPGDPVAAPEFHQLATVPAAVEWFANIDNRNTRRAYKSDVLDFTTFAGIVDPEEFR